MKKTEQQLIEKIIEIARGYGSPSERLKEIRLRIKDYHGWQESAARDEKPVNSCSAPKLKHGGMTEKSQCLSCVNTRGCGFYSEDPRKADCSSFESVRQQPEEIQAVPDENANRRSVPRNATAEPEELGIWDIFHALEQRVQALSDTIEAQMAWEHRRILGRRPE